MKFYVICSTPRSGSSLLCHLARQSGILGRPMEYFAPHRIEEMKSKFGKPTIDDLVRFLKRHRCSENGVFGFKAHYRQFKLLLESIDITRTFPGLSYVVIERGDLVMQAVSLAKARQTRAFSSKHVVRHAAAYDYRAVRRAMREILQERLTWEEYFAFCGIRPLVVTYESILEDPAGIIRGLATFLGVDGAVQISLDDVEIKMQRDAANDAWRQAAMRDFRVELGGGGLAVGENRRAAPAPSPSRDVGVATPDAIARASRRW